MRKKVFEWRLHQQENEDRIIKYCPQCNREVIFIDSQKRRRNANGKNIHEFAIYKCENGHTWNRKMSPQKPYKRNAPIKSQDSKSVVVDNELVNISLLKQQGFGIVEIVLAEVAVKCRLDVLLSEMIVDMSRTKIRKLIDTRSLMIDNFATKPGVFVHKDQVILINLWDI